ncbi:nucleotidyltransferase domain-containing protein [Herbiconiux sp. 11R-BC]|uniref:nucleotidyltransferase domain-containing protein n=1 Tax=Herbiconiux sp. 11R-BC TaxID=3111637 RepID=UPI003C0551E7
MGEPRAQSALLAELLPRVAADPRVRGVAVGGSLAAGTADEHSDIDLVVVIEDEDYPQVMAEKRELVAAWAPVLVSFTGEHVGEPRLIIALTAPPLLHVDLTFMRLGDVAGHFAGLRVAWDRTGAVAEALDGRAHPDDHPAFDAQWVEDRFWVWIHYAATKLARGELYEVLDMLAFLRSTVLGPLAALRAGLEPRGVRRLERAVPEAAAALEATVARYDARESGKALVAAVELYRLWMRAEAVERRIAAEEAAVAFLEQTLSR